MNDPRADRPIEQALRAWMEGAAPSQAPARHQEDTIAQTMKSRQARTYPWHRIALGGRSLTFAGSPAAAAVVVVGLLLLVAFVLALSGGGLRVSPSPSPSPRPSATLTPAATVAARSTLLPATSTTIMAGASIPVPDLLGWEIDGPQL